jgi:hypothetical protein
MSNSRDSGPEKAGRNPTAILDDDLRASAASSARARFVLLILTISSIIVFCSFWNARQRSWINSRPRRFRDAEQLRVWDKPGSAVRDAGDQRSYEDAKRFLDARGIRYGKEVIKTGLANLQRIQLEDVELVRAPLLGFAFDVNDLGVFGGITFVVVLMWFYYSLRTELRNLNLVFTRMREFDGSVQQRCYQLLAMGQVLTIPPSLEHSKRSSPSEKFWRFLPRVLFLVPVGVQLTVPTDDVLTWKHGWTISHWDTIFLYALSGSLLVASITLTCKCIGVARDIDKERTGVAQGMTRGQWGQAPPAVAGAPST